MCQFLLGLAFRMTGKRELHTFYCHPELVSGSLYVILSATQKLWIPNVPRPVGRGLWNDSIEGASQAAQSVLKLF